MKSTSLFILAFLSFILLSKPTLGSNREIQAGGDTTPVKLVQKGQEFQFVDHVGNPLIYNGNQSPKYNKTDLEHHLDLTQKAYDDAIKKIQQRAYREIKNLYNEKYIEEIIIDNILENYLKNIELKECIVSLNKLKKYTIFKQYMELCHAIYTDWSTREFVQQQNLPNVGKYYDNIIKVYNDLERFRQNLLNIQKSNDEAADCSPVFVQKGGIFTKSEEVLSIVKKAQHNSNKESYNLYLKEINEYFRTLGREPVNVNGPFHETIGKIEAVLREIVCKYSWYFDEDSENIKNWKSLSVNKEFKIPEFKDLNKKKHQLTPKAVIASSFLSKSRLLANENITVIDVGFRNQERFGGLWNDFVTKCMEIKANEEAWFQKHGEVDYIVYVEKDPSKEKKDKIVIAYSGSNSQIDWGINFTVGHREWEGLSVHQGIGWLFETSTKTFHSILMSRINDYYKNHRKPTELEIVTTGHSLGGALAGLAAYHYKKNLKEIENIIGHANISVKVFTFAAPAIIHKNSQKDYEKILGIENIYRIWVEGDPVVKYAGEDSSVQKIIQDSAHIGKNFSLGNSRNLPSNLLDLFGWGVHGANCYLSRLSTYISDFEDMMPEHLCKNLTEIMNRYIQGTHLDIYKENRGKLLPIIGKINKGNLSEDINLHKGLAYHIMKYSPKTFQIALSGKMVVGEICSHSPRYTASPSPRFKIHKGEIEANFTISETEIKYPISENSIHTIDSMKESLIGYNIDLPEKSVEKYSCGCYFAQRIFLSSQQLSLSEIFPMCIKDKACTVQYLQETRGNKNTLEHVQYILAAVGLEKKFQDMELDLNSIFNICTAYSIDEETCRRYLNGRLIYKPNQDNDIGKIEMRVADLANSLDGTFDLSQCGNAGKYLSISTGYKKGWKSENDKKIEIWFVPRFLVEKQINGNASHFKTIFPAQWQKTAPVGIFWTGGGWKNIGNYNYLTNRNLDCLSNNNLHAYYTQARSIRNGSQCEDVRQLPGIVAVLHFQHFFFEF